MTKTTYSKLPDHEENTKQKPSLWSNITYSWLTPLFKTASQRPLVHDDLPKSLGENSSKSVFERYYQNWKVERKRKSPKLWRVILMCMEWPMVFTTLTCSFLALSCEILLPVLLFLLLKECNSLEQHNKFLPNDTISQGNYNTLQNMLIQKINLRTGMYIVAISFVSFCANSFSVETVNIGALQGVSIQSGLTSLIYSKILTTRRHLLDRFTTGQLINLLSKDMASFVFVISALAKVVFFPFYLIACIILMKEIIGVDSMIAPGYYAFLYGCLAFFGTMLEIIRYQIITKSDQRLRLMTDLITGIRSIKINAWELFMEKLIGKARREEVLAIFKSNTLRAFSYTLMKSSSNVSIFLVVVTMLYTGGKIDPSKLFTLMTFVSSFPNALQSLWFAFEHGTTCRVALKRIQHFLLTEEDFQPGTSNSYRGADAKMSMISLKNLYCQLMANESKDNKNTRINILNNVNLNVSGPKLIAVIGKIGCGKSSLLNVILKELPITQGELSINGSIAIVPQTVWLFTGTIRDNIIFGKEYDEKWFNKVLSACALHSDLNKFPRRDLSYIGERGIKLSGGQKARVNLARAVYHNADIYLLDDPLSALDSNVGSHIFEQCIEGLLCNRLRILTTHHIPYLESVDQIVVMENGSMVEQGTYEEVCSSYPALEEMMNTAQNGKNGNENVVKSHFHKHGKQQSPNKTIEDDKQEEEDRAVGTISFKSYWKYLRSGNSIFVLIVVLVFCVLGQVASNASYWWLTYWSKLSDSQQKNTVNNLVYSGLTVVTVLFYFFMAMGILSVCLNASQELHRRMTSCIIHCDIRFFDTNPAGRILNRFSQDTANMDDLLVKQLLPFVFCIMIYLFVLVSISAYTPLMILPCILVLAAITYLIRCYLKASREVERLKALSASPLYDLFVQTYSGADVIRAFKLTEEKAIQSFSMLDRFVRASIICLSCQFWMCRRLFLVTSLFIFVASLVTLMVAQDCASVGLLTFYAINFSQVFFVGIFGVNMENFMTSVERIIHYTQLGNEPGYELHGKPPTEWPSKGSLSFHDITLKYYPGGPEVLKGINMIIESGEKVGIVGRTGAGKSSILAAIFRLPQSSSGSITIDNVVIENLNLVNSRTVIGCIPQSPFLFKGTIKFNLDPTGKCSTQDLWDALEQVQLKSLVASFPQGLEHIVSEEGSNFSVGERQLICLARVLLQGKKIVILDEATANVDFQTDQLIQDTIRYQLKDQTVITIAHRLDTALDYDKVIVVEDGKVVEVGKPAVLISQPNSRFGRMHQSYKNKGSLD